MIPVIGKVRLVGPPSGTRIGIQHEHHGADNRESASRRRKNWQKTGGLFSGTG
jgi:hypothetical protein